MPSTCRPPLAVVASWGRLFPSLPSFKVGEDPSESVKHEQRDNYDEPGNR